MKSTSETIVIKNATIIDGTGADPVPNGFVVIENEHIKEVGAGSPGDIPSNACLVDCQGQTLLPGLIDAHVHLGAVDANTIDQQRQYFPSLLVVKSLKIMEQTLDQGFTTVRDAGGADPGFREAAAQGLVPGPRVFVCGPTITQTGGHADSRLPTEIGPPVRHADDTNHGG